MRLASFSAWSRAIGLLALPGCVVSFNDYPLGDPQLEPVAGAGRAGAGAGGSATAGRSSGGSASQATPEGASLLDDFEDGNAAISLLEGRSATWYVANDGHGVQTPPGGTPLLPSVLSPARGASTQGVHTFGGPFSTWGALAGTAFVSNGNGGEPYDLSVHRGLRLALSPLFVSARCRASGFCFRPSGNFPVDLSRFRL